MTLELRRVDLDKTNEQELIEVIKDNCDIAATMKNKMEVLKRPKNKMSSTTPQEKTAAEYLQNDILIAIIFGIIFSIDWRTPYKKLVMRPKTEINFIAFKTVGYICAFLLFGLSVMSVMSNTYNPFIYFRFWGKLWTLKQQTN